MMCTVYSVFCTVSVNDVQLQQAELTLTSGLGCAGRLETDMVQGRGAGFTKELFILLQTA